MKRSGNHFQIEHLVEAVLNSGSPYATASPDMRSLAEEVRSFDCGNLRAVVLGGGTGLSTVVGGNSQLADWPSNPNVGLKQLFPCLDVVVCTTDDGRSTGKLLKHLPMIGIGDLRKLCLSMILPDNIEKEYGIDGPQRRALLRLIHRVFNHRFPEGSADCRPVRDPLLVAPRSLRDACPDPSQVFCAGWVPSSHPEGTGPRSPPAGTAWATCC